METERGEDEEEEPEQDPHSLTMPVFAFKMTKDEWELESEIRAQRQPAFST